MMPAVYNSFFLFFIFTGRDGVWDFYLGTGLNFFIKDNGQRDISGRMKDNSVIFLYILEECDCS